MLAGACAACNLVLLQTADGGTTWATVNIPMETLVPLDSEDPLAGVSAVTFFDAQDGWLIGGDLADTWVTHDAGAHWDHPYFAGLPTQDIEIEGVAESDGVASAVVQNYDRVGDFQIETSPVNREAWMLSSTTISVGALPRDTGSIQLRGSSGWAIDNDRVVSGGARLRAGSWVPWEAPCQDGQSRAVLAPSSPSSLAALCDGSVTGNTVYASFSNDGGVSFRTGDTSVPLSATAFVGAAQSPMAGALVAAVSNNDGASQLIATFDAGASWMKVFQAGAGQWSGLDFPESQLGFAALASPGGGSTVSTTASLLATSDGGHSWKTIYQGSGELDGLDFINASFGTAILVTTPGDPGTLPLGSLLTTVDGGRTWRNIPL